LEDNYSKKIIVVGSGLIGSLCSLMLTRNDYQVEYIQSDKGAELDRTYALTPNVIKWLKTFNLSNAFLKALNPVETIEVVKGLGENKIIFESNKLYIPALAYMVKEKKLLQEIQFQLKLNNHKELKLNNHKGDDFSILNGETLVKLNIGDKSLNAPLLIACDGSKSLIRKQQQIEEKIKKFYQTALVFEFKTTSLFSNKATQFFLGNSILAILPVNKGLMSVVWSCDNDFYEKLNDLNESGFKKKLIGILGADFGIISQITKRSSFPLVMIKAKQIFKKRVLLMGDAAHSIHPLSGQGLNLGIRDIMELEKNLKKGDYIDIGLLGFLRRYERSRKIDTEEFSILTAGLQWTFSLKGDGVNYLISKSMNLIEKTDFIKNKFIRRAIL